MLEILRSPRWIMGRRIVLVGIVLVVAYRQYGDTIISRLRAPNPRRDIAITRAEFRPEIPGGRPGWIIGFKNNSNKFTYDQIELQATYMDDKGAVLETDKLVVKQQLPPLDEKIIGSVDFKSRGAATRGTLTVTGAKEIR